MHVILARSCIGAVANSVVVRNLFKIWLVARTGRWDIEDDVMPDAARDFGRGSDHRLKIVKSRSCDCSSDCRYRIALGY